MNYTDSVSSNRSSKKQINRSEALELDNILVWEITSDSFRDYMISLQGYSDDNCTDRVMVCDGRKEATVISKYQRSGCSISCCSAACRMTMQEQDSYNSALRDGQYDQCIFDLFSLEINLNRVYGYHKSGKTYKKVR